MFLLKWFRRQKPGNKINICDLPPEILEKIIGNINILHHYRLRATCTCLKNVSEAYIMHEFEKTLNRCTKEDPKSRACAILTAIKVATEVYKCSGFQSAFCAAIPDIIQNPYRSHECNFLYLPYFLKDFYDNVAFLSGDPTSQRCRLLHTITLMRIISAFDKTAIKFTDLTFYSRIVFELRGLYVRFGMVISDFWHPRKWYDLLVVLSESLMAYISGQWDDRTWKYLNLMDVTVKIDKYDPSYLTKFIFEVHGSPKMRNLFRSFVENECENFQPPCVWPADEFLINMEIKYKNKRTRACRHMQLSSEQKIEQLGD